MSISCTQHLLCMYNTCVIHVSYVFVVVASWAVVVYPYTYIFLYSYIHIFVYSYIYISIYSYIHIHIFIYSQQQQQQPAALPMFSQAAGCNSPLGALLGTSWGPLGAILGPSWGSLKAIWGHTPRLADVGPKMGPRGPQDGPKRAPKWFVLKCSFTKAGAQLLAPTRASNRYIRIHVYT